MADEKKLRLEEKPSQRRWRTATAWLQYLVPAPCSQPGWSMRGLESPSILPSASLNFRDMVVWRLGVQILMQVRSVQV